MITELKPIHDSRASFYGKATIKDETTNGDSWIRLISYKTEVAKINKQKTQAIVNGTYSTTTLRHIKEFLLQNGFKAENKKQILKDYGLKNEN